MKRLITFIIHVMIIVATMWVFGLKAEISHMKVTKLYLEASHAIGTNTPHFRMEDRQVDGYLNLGYEAMAGKYVYTKTKILSMYSSSQFREVALDMELGLKPIKGIDIYLAHTSEHTLDMNGYPEHFPQKNAVGIRFNFIDQ